MSSLPDEVAFASRNWGSLSKQEQGMSKRIGFPVFFAFFYKSYHLTDVNFLFCRNSCDDSCIKKKVFEHMCFESTIGNE